MSMSIKKRLVLGSAAFTTVAAAATLVAGVTFGFFSSNATQAAGPNTFTSGNVAIGETTSAICSVGPMVPLDSSVGWAGNPVAGQTDTPTAACTFTVQNTSDVPAYIGLQLDASGGTNLYDATANGLQFQVSDGTTSYTTSGILNDSGGLSTNPLYVGKDTAGGTHTFTVNYFMPNSATANNYQGKTTTLKLTVYAVQAGNNGSAGTPGFNTNAGLISWS